MEGAITRIVIVGGGTAGWLSACRIAAALPDVSVTLIESPDVRTIGVGEGTWPTMRRTLRRIGIAEPEFLIACDASFKQGSRFDGWVSGAAGDRYYHPFMPPAGQDAWAPVAAWRRAGEAHGFAESVSAQPHVCAHDLAPRQRAMPAYEGALNYAYHLDAGKLASLLSRHATETLGVAHRRDHVDGVLLDEEGGIAAVRTREGGAVKGDLFLDCSGQAALLIGEALHVPQVDRRDVLFNDRALAMQVPVAPGSAIASQTNATAHAAGWLWDIGLPSRRGIGCVYSSAHASDDDAAATLRAYVARTTPGEDHTGLPVRRLSFQAGFRQRFWERNCLALGLSAGFVEPLEASAIVLVELSLDALLDNFPADRRLMAVQAKRFNALFSERWERIVEFLKLHYVPSRRTEPYWQDHRSAASIPPRLADLLTVWRHQPPSRYDLPAAEEVFPWASYQYVLYGMGVAAPVQRAAPDDASRLLTATGQRARALAASLPSNRSYLDALHARPPSDAPGSRS